MDCVEGHVLVLWFQAVLCVIQLLFTMDIDDELFETGQKKN